MKRWLPYLIIASVALITLAAGMVLYRTQKAPTLTATPEAAKPLTAETSQTPNPSQAPLATFVAIEEFGDFQCPPCRMLSEPLNEIVRDFGDKVRLTFRHFPLDKHLNARRASQAAEAARLQQHFWEMHHLLYQEQELWSKASTPDGLFVGYALKLGLDPAKFRQDMDSAEVNERISGDEARAATLGVSMTPTVFVNGKSLNLARGPASVRDAVEAEMAKAPGQP